jgi:hypothetical protein
LESYEQLLKHIKDSGMKEDRPDGQGNLIPWNRSRR